MAQFLQRVLDSLDDAEENLTGGAVDVTSSDLELGNDGATPKRVGLRWTTVGVPAGATIDSAFIQFQVDEINSVAVTIDIHGEDIDDAPAFSTGVNDITGRTLTTASASWVVPNWPTADVSGSFSKTPDIKEIIQEIIDRDGWNADQDIVLLVSHNAGTGTRIAESFDGVPSAAAQLEINYTEASGVPTITDVETDEDFDDKDTGITILGTEYFPIQGTGSVEIGSHSTFVSSSTKIDQTITSWDSGSIDITVVLSTLTPGSNWMYVTNGSGSTNENGFVITVHRAVSWVLGASGNISASGENTTGQLNAPSTGSFVAGRIQDDENPADTIDITADDYTEIEWSVKTTTDVNDDAYQFRIVENDNSVLDTYSVSPELTSSWWIAVASIQPARLHMLL